MASEPTALLGTLAEGIAARHPSLTVPTYLTQLRERGYSYARMSAQIYADLSLWIDPATLRRWEKRE